MKTLADIQNMVRIRVTGIKRTAEIKKYEKYISKIINKKLKKEKTLEKLSLAYALGLPYTVDDNGKVKIIRNFHFKNKKSNKIKI